MDATHNSGLSWKNGKISKGCELPVAEVFIRSGILISILSADFEIFPSFIKESVCTLLADVKAMRVTSLYVRFSKVNVCNGYHLPKYFRIGSGFQVKAYLGVGGRILATPFRNLFIIFSSFPFMGANIKFKADLYEFKTEKELPLSKVSVKKFKYVSRLYFRGSRCLLSQYSQYLLRQAEYCLRVPSVREASIICAAGTGMPLFKNDLRIISLPPGKFPCGVDDSH